MITKNIRNFLIAGSLCCGIVAALTACSDWDDHYEGTGAQEGASQTLWQQLSQTPEVSDFCKLLENTKVFRMHKRTKASYADLLNGGQSFTVVAPKNGTFNLDSLLQLVQTDKGDSVVEKFFVKNHLGRSANSVVEGDQQLLLLNSKHVTMNPTSIEGVTLAKSNIHAKNGVLHIVERPLPYTYSLYEALCDMPDMQAIGSFLRQYDYDWFDADASVSSGIVEGLPVYVDSVVIEINRMLNSIGLINAEDSTYWVVAPTTAGWNKAWEETSKYFVYDQKVLKRDSLQQYWTNRALLDDAIFNMTDQRNTDDSLVSVPYLNWRRGWTGTRPKFHVFNRPFDEGGILSNAQPVNCSNGVLYKTDEWPFTPEETYLKELWTECEQTGLLVSQPKNCTYNIRRVVADSISENGYLQVVPEKTTSIWEITFRVSNTLAADYDVYAIVLPKSVANQKNPDMKPCKFRASIIYTDENGVEQTYKCNNNKVYTTDAEHVDTLLLAEAFHVPVCNYNMQDIKFSVRLQCAAAATELRRFSNEMYLDCIYLRPRRTNN